MKIELTKDKFMSCSSVGLKIKWAITEIKRAKLTPSRAERRSI
jgi:hypothetical protein